MKSLRSVVLLFLAGVSLCHAQFHTNVITTPYDAFAYSVDGGPAINPTIVLYAGVTNILDIQTYPDHPVIIITNEFDGSTWYPGANPQSVNDLPISLTTPSSGFPTVLYYMCSVHGFYGEIDFMPPPGPVPPANTILSIRVGTNIVMTSTGTNTTWHFIPEFSSNLVQGAWAPVPDYNNSYANGTNTTVFNRLDPICGPNVFLRIRQQQN
jgi:hypothetical protein